MDRAQALADCLCNQRNNAQNDAANLAADLLVAKARIAELEKQVHDLAPSAE